MVTRLSRKGACWLKTSSQLLKQYGQTLYIGLANSHLNFTNMIVFLFRTIDVFHYYIASENESFILYTTKGLKTTKGEEGKRRENNDDSHLDSLKKI